MSNVQAIQPKTPRVSAATLDERIEAQRKRLFEAASMISCARVAAEDVEQGRANPVPNVSVTLRVVIAMIHVYGGLEPEILRAVGERSEATAVSASVCEARERRDLCVMLGHEVWTERAWRVRGERWNPGDFVAELDTVNGERLA